MGGGGDLGLSQRPGKRGGPGLFHWLSYPELPRQKSRRNPRSAFGRTGWSSQDSAGAGQLGQRCP